MSTAERIKLCRIIDKIENRESLLERLGMKNTSVFSKSSKEHVTVQKSADIKVKNV